MEPTLRGLRILVVDDDPAVRGLYVVVLQQAGATVTSSGLASEAVNLIDLEVPDAVVTDVQMPTHDGIWLLRELKARLPRVPVIAVSGHIDVVGLVDLQRLGFADVLTKPLGLSELTKAVARVVGR
jgi:DNA-binding NtrC family response regulator